MAKNKEGKNNFGLPGPYALARNRAGGDMAAGLLLYRIMWRWRMKKKLLRLGREWIAMSRSDWAREAGLSEAEMKNRALPKLRKQPFVRIRAMKLGTKKLLWISLDEAEAYQCTNDWEASEALFNNTMIGHDPKYPYQQNWIVNA
jgi:hypothetical protein